LEPYRPEAFFDLSETRAAGLFKDITYVWDAVAALPAYIEKIIEPEVLGEVEEGAWLEPGRVQLGEGSTVQRGAIVRGPTIIGRNTEVRSGAYIRGHVMVGEGCLIGHGTEMRQILILDRTNIPHHNCIFTSLVGNRVRISGFVNTANLLLKEKEVLIKMNLGGETQWFPTGLTYFGTIIGDDAKIGAHTLLLPGCTIGPRSLVHHKCSVSGHIPPDSILRPKSVEFEVVPKAEK